MNAEIIAWPLAIPAQYDGVDAEESLVVLQHVAKEVGATLNQVNSA